MKTFQPRYLWLDGAFHEKQQIVIDEDGLIVSVGPIAAKAENPVLAGDEAFFPGLCNVHSHTFQIALRGRTQHRPPDLEDQDDTFWTWRETMYRVAEKVDPEGLYALSALAFLEMLRAGITSVGEFHYLHHDANGRPYKDPNEMTKQVLRAARDTGIRISLLDVFYERGGFQRPLDRAQKRFSDADLNAYFKRLEELPKLMQGGETWGIAPHSVRAVGGDNLRRLGETAEKFKVPLHMHVQEQPKEVRECKEEHGGRTPTEVLADLGLLSERFTAVHAVHLTKQDFFLMKKHRISVCACPTTERDLGDGVIDSKGFIDRKIPLCLGTDSQVLINPFEDARALEYQMRLKTQQRNILAEEAAPLMAQIASENGIRALGLNAGRFEKGRYADLIGINLNDSSLAGADAKTLATAMFFSMAQAAIRRVMVGGRDVLVDGKHATQEAIHERAAEVLSGF